jgi:hypothetical protein
MGWGGRRSGAEILRRSPHRTISAQHIEQSAEIALLVPQNDNVDLFSRLGPLGTSFVSRERLPA